MILSWKGPSAPVAPFLKGQGQCPRHFNVLQRPWNYLRCCYVKAPVPPLPPFSKGAVPPSCTPLPASLFAAKWFQNSPDFLNLPINSPIWQPSNQRWAESPFPDSDSTPVHALRLLLCKILELHLRLLLTFRKLPSNSFQKDSVYFASWGKIYVVAILPLTEDKWLKWSCDKHNTERHNMLRFRVMA